MAIGQAPLLKLAVELASISCGLGGLVAAGTCFHSSGAGKALLAFRPAAEARALMSELDLRGYTAKTITTLVRLEAALAEIRKQGFAVDDEEAEMGLRCVAAVVYNALAEPLAAISVSGLTSRVTDARLPEIGRVVREVAAELTAALGGVTPVAKPA